MEVGKSSVGRDNSVYYPGLSTSLQLDCRKLQSVVARHCFYAKK